MLHTKERFCVRVCLCVVHVIMLTQNGEGDMFRLIHDRYGFFKNVLIIYLKSKLFGCFFGGQCDIDEILFLFLAPKELYRVPVTDNQQYGWWVSTDGLKNQEPWTQTRRFPRKNSEMTKYEES